MFTSINKYFRLTTTWENWITNLSDLLLGKKWKTKISQQSKEGVYQHQITDEKQWNCGLERKKPCNEELKALSKFFVKELKFNFWQIWHLKLLDSCLNWQSHVSQHEAWNIWQHKSASKPARNEKETKTKNNSAFWKIDFTPNYCLLTLILGFFCRSFLDVL